MSWVWFGRRMHYNGHIRMARKLKRIIVNMTKNGHTNNSIKHNNNKKMNRRRDKSTKKYKQINLVAFFPLLLLLWLNAFILVFTGVHVLHLCIYEFLRVHHLYSFYVNRTNTHAATTRHWYWSKIIDTIFSYQCIKA